MKASVTWQEGMAFKAHLDGFDFLIDASEKVGGRNLGPRPKGLTLVSLAGCTGMDVISILGKMRVEVDRFSVDIDARLVEDHPRKFSSITITYVLEGKDIPADKVRKAVSLSENRYCGVSASLKPAVSIGSEIEINGERIDPVAVAEED